MKLRIVEYVNINGTIVYKVQYKLGFIWITINKFYYEDSADRYIKDILFSYTFKARVIREYDNSKRKDKRDK